MCGASSIFWEKIIGNWSLCTTHVRMNNVAMYQNEVYTHNINKIFTRVTSNAIDAPLETEYTAREFGTSKLTLHHSQYILQRVDIWKNCNVTISMYTYNFSFSSH